MSYFQNYCSHQILRAETDEELSGINEDAGFEVLRSDAGCTSKLTVSRSFFYCLYLLFKETFFKGSAVFHKTWDMKTG